MSGCEAVGTVGCLCCLLEPILFKIDRFSLISEKKGERARNRDEKE